MAMISSARDIDQFLEMLLHKMVKHGAISKGQAQEMKQILAPAIAEAGGFNPDKPDALNKLKQGICAVAMCQRVGENPALSMQNLRTLRAEQAALVSLVFKDKLSPQERTKYSLGMAYLLVLEKNPDMKLNLALAMKDPKKMTMEERKELGNDLEKVMTAMNGMQMNPIDAAVLAGAIKEIKLELAKDPNKVKTPAENKELENSMTALFGMDPSTPGKITGPIQCMMGNTMGIADNFPAMGSEPIHGYSGDILNATMQAATGAYELEKSRDADLGEVFAEDQKNEAAPEKPEPTAVESLTTSFAEVVQTAAAETFSAKDNKENVAPKVDVEPEYKPKTPFDSKQGPKPTSAA